MQTNEATVADYVGMTGVGIAIAASLIGVGQAFWGIFTFFLHRLITGDLSVLVPVLFVAGLTLALVGLVVSAFTKASAK